MATEDTADISWLTLWSSNADEKRGNPSSDPTDLYLPVD
jgi:hypothetical protein